MTDQDVPSSSDPSGPSPAPASFQQTTLLSLAAALIARRRFVLGTALAGAVAAAAWALIVTPQYRVVTRFAPEERTTEPFAGGFASLAAQFGAMGVGGSRPLQFYADVVLSPDLVKALALDSFPDPDSGSTKQPLLDILRVKGKSHEKRLDTAVEYLRTRAVSAAVNDRTGIVTLTVTLPRPVLAARVAGRLYERLEGFNYNTRKSAASERRRFAERELASARAELTAAEDALRDFLEANRDGLSTPRLAFRRDRLQRRIDLLQEVNTTLARELEQAKVAEVRDTPVFTVIQVPDAPLERYYPRRTRMTVLGALLGAALAIAVISLQASGWSAQALDPRGYAALRAVLRPRRSAA